MQVRDLVEQGMRVKDACAQVIATNRAAVTARTLRCGSAFARVKEPGGLSTTVFVALLVVGILVVLVLIWDPILAWLRRRSRTVAEQLGTEIEGETVVRAPEKGSYRGATAPGYPAVKNTGLIASPGDGWFSEPLPAI